MNNPYTIAEKEEGFFLIIAPSGKTLAVTDNKETAEMFASLPVLTELLSDAVNTMSKLKVEDAEGNSAIIEFSKRIGPVMEKLAK